MDQSRRDWKDDSGGSTNQAVGMRFAEAIFNRVRARESGAGSGTYAHQTDVLLVAGGPSLYPMAQFAKGLTMFFPQLRIEVVDSKRFASDPEGYNVGPDTVVFGYSHSGQYFNTVDDIVFFQSLHEIGKCGPVFGMVGQIDAVPMGKALGKSYKHFAKPSDRLFFTHVGWVLDESKPGVSLAAGFTLAHMLVSIGRQAHRGGVGITVSREVLEKFDGGLEYLVRRAESISGFNIRGEAVASNEKKEIVKEARRHSRRLVEYYVVIIATTIALALVIHYATNPAQMILQYVQNMGSIDLSGQLGTVIYLYLALTYFLFFGYAVAMVFRFLIGNPNMIGRYLTPPTLFLADTPFVHQTFNVFFSKLFSLAYGWAGWASHHTAETDGDALDRFHPLIKRGDVMVIGSPNVIGSRNIAQNTSTQALGSVSVLGSTGYSIGVGHGRPQDGKYDAWIGLGPLDPRNGLPDGNYANPSHQSTLFEDWIFSQERLLAYFTFFHANAVVVQRFTNLFVILLKWVGLPLIVTVWIASFGRLKTPLLPWRLGETHGRAGIFTTQVGNPIGISPENYVPRGFYTDGIKPGTTNSGKETKAEMKEEETTTTSKSFPWPLWRARAMRVVRLGVLFLLLAVAVGYAMNWKNSLRLPFLETSQTVNRSPVSSDRSSTKRILENDPSLRDVAALSVFARDSKVESGKAGMEQKSGVQSHWALLIGLLGPAGGALNGLNGRRRLFTERQPGAFVRRMVMAGRRANSAGDFAAAVGLMDEIDHPRNLLWDVRAVRLALGYGALSAHRWGLDRGLSVDFFKVRNMAKGSPLTRTEKRALNTVAREGSQWRRVSPAKAIEEGALPVLYLADAQVDSPLFNHWFTALARYGRGGAEPVLVVQSEDQGNRLVQALEKWRENHSEGEGEAVDLFSGRWVFLDSVDDRVAERNANGAVEQLKLGALLKSVGVEFYSLRTVDVVTEPTSRVVYWDRSDLPKEVDVNLILGLFRNLSLVAPLEQVQNVLRFARTSLAAA